MKILLIAPRYMPIFNKEKKGAVEKLIKIYLYHNESVGDSITVYSPKVAKDDYDGPFLKHVTFRNIDQTTNKYKVLRIIYGFKKRCLRLLNNECYIRTIAKDIVRRNEQNNYDLIIFENGEQDIPIFKQITKTRKRIVLHLHNDYINKNIKNSKKIIDSCDEIWPISNYLAKRIQDVKKTRIRVISNTIDDCCYREDNIQSVKNIIKKYDFFNDIVFLYVGRLMKSKGVIELLEAFDKYSSIRQNSKLLIAGATEGGKKGKKLQRIIDRHCAKNANIIQLGYLTPEEVVEYQAVADCQIIPSICNEAFGLVLLEAMKANLEIIATRTGGIPEVGEDKIRYVNKKTIVRDLMSEMMKINKGQKRIDKNKHKYKSILDKYSKEKFCGRIEEGIHENNYMRKKALIINQGHTQNIGDKAILETMEYELRTRGYMVDFVPYCDENDTYGPLWKRRLFRMFVKPLFIKDLMNSIRVERRIKNSNYDVAIIGGGELLSGHTEFNVAFKAWVKALNKKRIPTDLLGVSGDLKMSKRKLNRYGKAILKCRNIYVRDNYTQKIIKKKYGRSVSVRPDVVFLYKKMTGDRNNYDTSKKNKTAMIVPISLNDKIKDSLKVENEDEYFQIYLKAIPSDIKRIIITPTVEKDEKTCERMKTYFNKKIKGVSIEFVKYGSVNSYIEFAKQSGLIISGRMHAMIIGLQYGNRIKVIDFKEKLTTFKKEYGANVNLDEVFDMAANQFENYSNIE